MLNDWLSLLRFADGVPSIFSITNLECSSVFTGDVFVHNLRFVGFDMSISFPIVFYDIQCGMKIIAVYDRQTESVALDPPVGPSNANLRKAPSLLLPQYLSNVFHVRSFGLTLRLSGTAIDADQKRVASRRPLEALVRHRLRRGEFGYAKLLAALFCVPQIVLNLLI